MVRVSWKMAVALVLGGLSVLLMLAHVALFGAPRALFFHLAPDAGQLAARTNPGRPAASAVVQG